MWVIVKCGNIYAADYDHKEMIFRGICATRQLAKRQITWLRGWKSPIQWLDSLHPTHALEKVLASVNALSDKP